MNPRRTNRLPHGRGSVSMLSRARQQAVALLCVVSLAPAQEIAAGPSRRRPSSSGLICPLPFRPFASRIRTRLRQLIRAGMLYLTAQDAIALVLENNIDIEVSRYNPFISEWNLERAEAGGALPGVPSGASQAGSVASGQGVLGSQSAAGVSAPGASLSKGGSANATISQIGPVTPEPGSYRAGDHILRHTSSPQAGLGAEPGCEPDSGHARVHRQLSTGRDQRRHRRR